MSTFPDRVSAGIARALEYVIAALLVGITALVFANVLTRYVLLYSIIWSEEVARFSFIWLIFLGTAVAIKRGAHFHLTIFEFKKGSLPRLAARSVGAISILLLSFVMVTEGWRLVESTMRQSSPNMGIPMGYAYLSIPLSGVLTLLFQGLDLLSLLSKRANDQPAGRRLQAASPER